MIRFFAAILFFSSYLYSEPFDPQVVYLTWLKSPETSMAVQWITEGVQDSHDDVSFRETETHTEGWQMEMGKHYPFPGNGRYLLHRVELNNLKPDTGYSFKIGIDGKEYKFRTMPKTLEIPVRFVVGGDMYHDDIQYLTETNRMAAKFNPSFAVAGGDLAYASSKLNFKPQKMERWLTWLETWKKDMVTEDGMMIPLLAAIGNHDVQGGFNQTPAEAKIFYLLFRGDGQPGYQVIDFGSYLSFFILDTDHTAPIPFQVPWLAGVLSERGAVTHKMASYHVPAYPSHRNFRNTYSAAIRKYWVPLFEKFHLDVAFEHHDHDYKRTYPLIKGRPNPLGVVYMGDGAWGIGKPREPRKQLNYLAKSAPIRHFIGVTLQKDSRRMQAISSKGALIDEVQQAINKVIPNPEGS